MIGALLSDQASIAADASAPGSARRLLSMGSLKSSYRVVRRDAQATALMDWRAVPIGIDFSKHHPPDRNSQFRLERITGRCDASISILEFSG